MGRLGEKGFIAQGSGSCSVPSDPSHWALLHNPVPSLLAAEAMCTSPVRPCSEELRRLVPSDWWAPDQLWIRDGGEERMATLSLPLSPPRPCHGPLICK